MKTMLDAIIHDLTAETAQQLANYRQVEAGLLRLETWKRHRKDLLGEMDLLLNLAQVMRDYDSVLGEQTQAAWRQRWLDVLNKAKAAGYDPIPF